MRRVRVFQVDAFTRQPFSGNPAGVVLDAGQLDERQMRLIARELNNGDTAFLLPADGADHDLRVRFFTPRREVGFVGHATIAAHTVLAALGLTAPRLQKQNGSIVAIERRESQQGCTIAFTQPAPRLRGPLDPAPRRALLAALGLQEADLDQRCPVTLAGEHGSRCLVGVRDGACLARLQPDLAALAALSAAGAAPGFFVYTLQPALADCDSEARMFCPALGIPEDPVSGNAHAMLAVLLQQLRLLPGGAACVGFRGRQGHHMGRAGELEVGMHYTHGLLSEVSVSGTAVVIFETSIALATLAA
jgi:PhzF family phenazine biosynthesis protein